MYSSSKLRIKSDIANSGLILIPPSASHPQSSPGPENAMLNFGFLFPCPHVREHNQTYAVWLVLCKNGFTLHTLVAHVFITTVLLNGKQLCVSSTFTGTSCPTVRKDQASLPVPVDVLRLCPDWQHNLACVS